MRVLRSSRSGWAATRSPPVWVWAQALLGSLLVLIGRILAAIKEVLRTIFVPVAYLD